MKPFSLRNLFAGLAVTALLSANASAAPISFGGHYYDVVAVPGITWDDARAAALSSFYLGLQGHLVTITSAAEDAAVSAAIVANGSGEMWAGGFQTPANNPTPTAGWTWVNGEGSFPGVTSAVPYANWAGGEPNDFYGVASEQYMGLNFNNGWNDEAALENIYGYVIEYDPDTINDVVPEPASLTLLGGGLLGLVKSVRRRRRSQQI